MEFERIGSLAKRGLAGELLEKVVDNREVLGKAGDSTLLLFKNSTGNCDDIITVLLKHGDEAGQLYGLYGDDVIDIALRYGDEGLGGIRKHGTDFLVEYSAYGDDFVQSYIKNGDEVLELVIRYSDDGMEGIQKYGDKFIELYKSYGDEFAGNYVEYGDDVVDVALKYGEEGLDVIRKHGQDFLTGYAAYGDEFVQNYIRYGDEVIGMVVKYGDNGMEGIRKYGDKFVELYKSYGDEFAGNYAKYGDDAVDAYVKYGNDAEKVLEGSTSAKGLIGHDFEEYLSKTIGGDGSFSVGGRDFDGGVGSRWWEAKSGNYWSMLEENSNELAKFKSDMGDRLRIATENGATYELFSNTPIPESIKQWLTKKGIPFTELLD